MNKFSDNYGINTGTTEAEMDVGSKRSLKGTIRRMEKAGVNVDGCTRT